MAEKEKIEIVEDWKKKTEELEKPWWKKLWQKIIIKEGFLKKLKEIK